MLPAGGVAVEVSADGQQYTQIAEKALKHDCPETGRIAFTDSIEFEPTQATFLKVKIKNGVPCVMASISKRTTARKSFLPNCG